METAEGKREEGGEVPQRWFDGVLDCKVDFFSAREELLFQIPLRVRQRHVFMG